MSRRRNTHYSHKHENRPTKAEREAQKQTARFDEDDDTFVELAEVQQSATDFLEKYQKHIVGVASVIILLVGAYLAYKHLVVAPKEKAAVEAIYKAQAQFEQDSFALALENTGGGFDGFITIIAKYIQEAQGSYKWS
ncbi:MAG TPA: hypothetical protein PK147_10790, partial [Saprospiraceae bacterium]|nr:hypothetical protein [Saprospiraceae bacterium]